MRAAFVCTALLFVLAGCQTGGAPALSASGESVDQILSDPALTAEIAADLATHVSTVIPSGSSVRIGEEHEGDLLSHALGERLASLGHQSPQAGSKEGAAIPLSIWRAEVGNAVMLRLSTPTHALSRIYARANPAHDKDGAQTQAPGIEPQGPLLVEHRLSGAAS